MNIKNKAVIMRPDRKNDIVTLKKKQLEGKHFRHADYMYAIDPDRFQLTFQRNRFGLRRPFVTFYYVQGVPQPLPVPFFQSTMEPVCDAQGVPQVGEDGKPVMARVFPEVINNGINAEDMAVLWNPWFLRTLAAKGAALRQDIQFWLVCGIAVVSLYIAWSVHDLPTAVHNATMQALADYDHQKAVDAALEAAKKASEIGSPAIGSG